MPASTWGLLAAIAVGAVLVASGVAKLASHSWRSQAGDLGVPAPVASTVPYVEVVVGALLLVQWQRHLMGWVAALLFAAFTVLLVVRIAQGRRPPCACFGSLSVRPIGPWHVARNLVLIALSVCAAVL